MPDLVNWHWPQWAVAGLYFIGLLVAARRHGSQKMGHENFWTVAGATALVSILLWFGGFWTP